MVVGSHEIVEECELELADKTHSKQSDLEYSASSFDQQYDPNLQTAANFIAENESAHDVVMKFTPVAELEPARPEVKVGEKKKLQALQRWLQKFIRDEGILIGNSEESINLPSTDSEISSSTWNIHTVPDRLKKYHDKEEDCFTPQAFPIGLHNLVSCFDASKLQFKVDVARAFSKYAIPGNPKCPEVNTNSERWKRLVRAIVGESAEEHKRVRDAYKDFRVWELRLEATSQGQGSQTVRHWHFAFLLAVDAVFLVTSLQASIPGRNYCDYSESIKSLIEDKKLEIAEFQKWDLSLVENQVPLKLLREVIKLQVTIKTDLRLDSELDLLIKYAVWLSYPFLPSGFEGDDCCRDFVGCCCPCSSHDFIFEPRDNDSDPEAGSTSSTRSVDWSSGNDFDCFDQDWNQTYSEKLMPDNYVHLLHCTYVVSSWLTPVASRNSSISRSLPSTSGQYQLQGASFERVTSQTVRTSRRKLSSRLQLWTWKYVCAGRRERKVRIQNQRTISIWNEDRIPSATELRDAGVRIRGVATSLSSPSLESINFWTVLTSLCCFSTFLACCFESSCPSYITRWRASLELPRVKMYTETKRLLRNLALYEQLAHGWQNGHLRNYIKTMRCLVHREEDVLLLIRSGVIQSHLAGPKDVVHTWKFIDDALEAVPLGGPWVKIYRNLHEHLKNRWKNWYARFWISNCSNPLVACSFVIFSIIFLLSAVQTYLNVAKSTADGSGSLWWP